MWHSCVLSVAISLVVHLRHLKDSSTYRTTYYSCKVLLIASVVQDSLCIAHVSVVALSLLPLSYIYCPKVVYHTYHTTVVLCCE